MTQLHFSKLLLVLGVFVAFAATAFAADFRVVSTVSAPAADGKAVSTVTSQMIFIDGVVYNFIDPHGEITVYDPAHDTFAVIDPELRLQTRIAVGSLCESIEKTRESLVKHSVPLVAFAASPVFRESLDLDSGVMKLTSELFDYEIETMPVSDAAIVTEYYDAADKFCYLNFRLQPGPHSLKYLVRLAVNRSLREAKRLPKKIVLDFYPKEKKLLAKAEHHESRHEIFSRVSDTDRQRLDQAQQMMRTFKQIPFDEYQTEVEKKMQVKQ
ncbi:MAG: hypothetical protein ACRC46_03900 [Thermoguttaceae bacterium]